MLLVTNRTLNEGSSLDIALPRPVSFKENDTAVQQEVFFCDYEDSAGRLQEIGSQAFYDRIKSTSHKIIFHYIHGCCTGVQDAIDYAKRFQRLFDQKSQQKNVPPEILVVPWVWPSQDKIIKYWRDQLLAEASGFSFARAFLKIQDYIQETNSGGNISSYFTKWQSIFCHSMGNRVFRRTVREAVQTFDANFYLFDFIFLGAADIPNEALTHKDPGLGDFIPETCQYTLAYHASDDIALITSVAANLFRKGRMLGQTGFKEPNNVDINAYEVDCDGFNGRFGGATKHNYFWDDDSGAYSPCLNHMYECMTQYKLLKYGAAGNQIVIPS